MNAKKIIIPAVILLALQVQVFAEFIFLKDGSIIEGKVINDRQGSIVVRGIDNKNNEISRKDIIRVTYGELKKHKVYVRKRNGNELTAYLVEEDRDLYTFRMDLYKPEEFILKKKEILAIDENNPTELRLREDPETDEVFIEWTPPLARIESFNIYWKTSETDEYKLTGSTRYAKTILKNLTPGCTYYLTVTSVDKNGFESPRSNELKVTAQPGKKIAKSEDGCSSQQKIVIDEFNAALGFSYIMVFPLGKYSEMYDEPGIGGMLSLSRYDFIFTNLYAGISAGYYSHTGLDLIEEKNIEYKKLSAVPGYLSAGYNFELGHGFSLRPQISIGVTWVNIVYYDRMKSGEDITDNYYEPSLKAGMYAEYIFFDKYSAIIGLEYGGMVEIDGILDFIQFSAGLQYIF